MLFRRAKAFDPKKLPWAALSAALIPALEDTVADATAGAIAAALARGLEFDPDVIAEAVAEMLPGYVEAWEAAVLRTTGDRVSAAVAQYTAGETSLEQLMASVDTLFDPARAELMAVSETTRLFTVIGGVINEQAGVEKVRFLTVRDPWVDEECAALDNMVFTLDELDESNEPPIHPNCRCMLAPEVPEAVSREPVAA